MHAGIAGTAGQIMNIDCFVRFQHVGKHVFFRGCLLVVLFMCPHVVWSNTPELTLEEQHWLKSHPVIRIAPDPSYPPIEWLDASGTYQGLAAEYVHLFEKMLGVHFKIVPADSWSTALQLIRAGKIDVLPAAMVSDNRLEFLSFTEPYVAVSGVVISSHQYDRLEQLKGKKVAVVTDYIWDELLTPHQIDVRLVRVEDAKTAIELTAMGAVDAMIGDIANATYVIQQEGVTNLNIVSTLDKKLELSFAVRKDWPLLLSILQKSLDRIPGQEKKEILDKWVKLQLPPWWKSRQLQYIVLGVFGCFLFIILIFFTWNRMLTYQVRFRTRQLEEAQNRLIKAARLESVGQLAAGVAHEVKNPLGIVQMGVDYLKGEKKNCDEVVWEILEDMTDAVRRADKVISGLLDYSRDSKLAKEKKSINKILDHSLHLVEHELKKKNIAVQTELESDLPDIMMDSGRIQQVAVNVFMNAIQAMEPDGLLTVCTKVKLVSQEESNRDAGNFFAAGEKVLAVEISDTGHGIPAENIDKVIDPFFTTKPVGQGTGLGLAICRNIMEMHRGSLHIGNRKNKGVVVQLFFPL